MHDFLSYFMHLMPGMRGASSVCTARSDTCGKLREDGQTKGCGYLYWMLAGCAVTLCADFIFKSLTWEYKLR